MPAKLDAVANEEGSYAITASFTDEEGAAVTPNALTWTLAGDKGDVINNRNQIAITPDTSVTIRLQGDDLKFREGEKHYNRVTRHVLIEGDYDSTLGTGNLIKAEVSFDLDNLTVVNP